MVALHVEPSTRCTLACPKCERTTFIDKFGKKNFAITDLDIATFEHFVDVKPDRIDLCGNSGDPIYHRDFLSLVSVAKNLSPCVKITTNGSRKTAAWWHQLCKQLDHRDLIVFSIDGTPENFTQYRVNADWPSIRVGIEVCAEYAVRTRWKYIPMSFNEHDIDDVRELSQQLGMDHFYLYKSPRFDKDDPFAPSADLIQDTYQTQQSVRDGVNDFELDPECGRSSMHYLSADGYYAPCCYVKDYMHWYRSDWRRNSMHMSEYSFTQCISRFEKFYSTIHSSRPEYCVFHCGKC